MSVIYGHHYETNKDYAVKVTDQGTLYIDLTLGLAIRKTFAGNEVSRTFDYADGGTGFAIINDGATSLTFTLYDLSWEVKSGELFDEFMPFFYSITLVNPDGNNYRAFIRG